MQDPDTAFMPPKGFFLGYQVQVEITGYEHGKPQVRMVGAEALARRLEAGYIHKAHTFVPDIYKSGGGRQFEAHTLEQACYDLQGWVAQAGGCEAFREQFPDFRVSVNVSRLDDRLVEQIERATMRYQVPAQFLRVELLETAYIDDPTQANETARELIADHGVQLVLDDCATYRAHPYDKRRGHFAVLDLNLVSKVKLDKSLVHGLEKSGKQTRRIIEYLQELGETYGFILVAEGIETITQARLVDGVNVPRQQGYLFGRAATPNIFKKRHLTSTLPSQ